MLASEAVTQENTGWHRTALPKGPVTLAEQLLCTRVCKQVLGRKI